MTWIIYHVLFERKQMTKEKINNGVLYNSMKDVNELVQMSLPPIPSLKLAKNVKAISDAIKIIEEVRVSLVKKYGKETAEGKGDFSIDTKDKKAIAAFQKDYNEILNESSDVTIEKLTVTENWPSIKSMTILNLSFMFEDMEEEKKVVKKKVKPKK